MPAVEICPLVPGLPLPVLATGRLRASVPEGYGVEEQCLPFVAAAALGFLLPAPIRFGLCVPQAVPVGAHAFRSPLDRLGADGAWRDPRVFYVCDRPESRFLLNAYEIPAAPPWPGLREPGLSFFDRDDQDDLFKLHLPYIWRTPAGLEALFLPPLNRPGAGVGLQVAVGLVETEWYGNPVNLVLRKPPADQALHVAAGQPIAQVVFLNRANRQPELRVVPEGGAAARHFQEGLRAWHRDKRADRSAYKRLARRQAPKGG